MVPDLRRRPPAWPSGLQDCHQVGLTDGLLAFRPACRMTWKPAYKTTRKPSGLLSFHSTICLTCRHSAKPSCRPAARKASLTGSRFADRTPCPPSGLTSAF